MCKSMPASAECRRSSSRPWPVTATTSGVRRGQSFVAVGLGQGKLRRVAGHLDPFRRADAEDDVFPLDGEDGELDILDGYLVADGEGVSAHGAPSTGAGCSRAAG